MRTGETITIPDLTPDSSTIHDIKTIYAQKTGLQQDKIKLLLNKKPAADLKTLKELGVDADFELSVMIMGGATPSAGASQVSSPVVEKGEPVLAAAAAPVAVEDKMDVDSPAPESEKAQVEATEKASAGTDSAEGILQTEEFWSDLKGFLVQRLRDEEQGAKVAKTFREAWKR